MTPSSDTVEIGRGVLLIAVTKDSAGNVTSSTPLTWSTSAVGIATVTGGVPPYWKAVVAGVTTGSAVVSATASGKIGTAAIVVRGPATDLTFVNAGGDETCALAPTGAAYCWGLSVSPFGYGGAFVPVAVTRTLTFTSLSTSSYGGCGVTAADIAYCWGVDSTSTYTVAPVAGGPAFADVKAAVDFRCGLTPTGAAYCWGLNVTGQLGNGSTMRSAVPVAVSGGLTFRAIRVGGDHDDSYACGITTADAAYCWGNNHLGQLGDGSTTDHSLTPVPVAGGLAFQALSVGGDTFNSSTQDAVTCGITTAGSAYCWGGGDDSTYVPLGAPATDRCPAYHHAGSVPCTLTPIAVQGGPSFTSVTVGRTHACGLTPAGAAYCWGANTFGQLGTGASDASAHPTPLLVAGGLVLTSLSAGDDHTCGVTTAGAVYCWGLNNAGQIGDGIGFGSHPAPVRVFGQP